jgi:hypothetical protein
MKRIKLLLLLLISCLVLAVPAHALSPLISVSAQIDGLDQPTGTQPVVFTLYTDLTDEDSGIWSETKDVTFRVVGTGSGAFSTTIGENTPLLPEYFENARLYIGIKVAGIDYGKIALHATPFSISASHSQVATTVETVTDNFITNRMIQSISADKVVGLTQQAGILSTQNIKTIMNERNDQYVENKNLKTGTYPNITGLNSFLANNAIFSDGVTANVFSGSFKGDGSKITGVIALLSAQDQATLDSVPDNITASLDSKVNSLDLGSLGTLDFITNSQLINGNYPSIESVGTLDKLNVTSTVTANRFVGDGSGLTGIIGALTTQERDKLTNVPVNTNSTLATKANTSDLAAIATSGQYSDLIGEPNLGSLSQLNAISNSELSTGTFARITGVGTLGALTVSGAIAGSSAGFSGPVTASGFVGDGSQLTNIAGLVTSGDQSRIDNLPTNTTASFNALHLVSTSGSYADLNNKPALTSIALSGNSDDLTIGSNVNGNDQLIQLTAAGKIPALDGSLLTNLVGAVSSNDEIKIANLPQDTIASFNELQAISRTANSDDLTIGSNVNGNDQLMQLTADGKLPTLDGSNLINLVGSVSANDETKIANLPQDTTASFNALHLVATSGSYSHLTDLPTYHDIAYSGAYSDLVGAPTLHTVAISGSYSHLTDQPTYNNIAYSGSSDDLTIGSNVNGNDQLVQLTAAGKLPAVDGSNLTNITGSVSANDLTKIANIPQDTIASINALQTVAHTGNTDDLTIGSNVNGNDQLVQLSATGKLPAVDGSNLTNITGSVSANDLTKIANMPQDTVASINALHTVSRTGNTDDLTIGSNVNGNDQLVQLSATGKLPAVDGSNLTNITGSVSANDLTKIANIPQDTIASINSLQAVAHTGNTDDLTIGSNVNGNDQLVQLSATGKLPAVDGSNLTNITGSVSANDLTKIANIPQDTVASLNALQTVSRTGQYSDLIGAPSTTDDLAVGSNVNGNNQLLQLNSSAQIPSTDIIIKNVIFEQKNQVNVSGAGYNINWTQGSKQRLALSGDTTVVFSNNPSQPGHLMLILYTNGFTVTWPAAIKWPDGQEPILSSDGTSVDIATIYFDGINYYGLSAIGFK